MLRCLEEYLHAFLDTFIHASLFNRAHKVQVFAFKNSPPYTTKFQCNNSNAVAFTVKNMRFALD